MDKVQTSERCTGIPVLVHWVAKGGCCRLCFAGFVCVCVYAPVCIRVCVYVRVHVCAYPLCWFVCTYLLNGKRSRHVRSESKMKSALNFRIALRQFLFGGLVW